MRFALAIVALLLMTSPALAGNCPVCDGPEDCPGGFCVLHESDVGCGTMLQICCPGQACALGADGRPTCEAAGTCVVVGEADAGPPDGNTDLPDAQLGFDAMGGDTATDSGCDCRASGTSGASPLAALAGLAALFVLRRRP